MVQQVKQVSPVFTPGNVFQPQLGIPEKFFGEMKVIC